jgi:hypothetical protein
MPTRQARTHGARLYLVLLAAQPPVMTSQAVPLLVSAIALSQDEIANHPTCCESAQSIQCKDSAG